MPSTADNKVKTTLPTQTEKPIHYQYLKEFRVEQCQLFLQHKCTQHKPFTCFYWHFMNQRRRKPTRRRDGTFNYSPDNYCSKYDETTGVCPDGDECQLLHRTAGDTERRYHLKYYKTDICVYDTDSRGYCVKNGAHCAFAHGIHDIRSHVYDIRELQGIEGSNDNNNGIDIGPNSLDKERYALTDDPKWQDTAYVLANYKTELCKRPPRLCRQGYACPQYHNNKDKRRSPKKYKYRSTPCPNVKQGDEWGDPVNCETGDSCAYCHTRTEQQFHPEIYKSTKCNDMQQTGYCPRGPFCAFAHVEKEISATRDLSMECTNDISTLLSTVLPPSTTTGASTNSNITVTNTNSNTNETVSVNSNANAVINQQTNELVTNGPDSFNLLTSQNHGQQKQENFINSNISTLTNFDISANYRQTQLYKREQTSPINSNSIVSTSTNAPGPGPIARPRAQSTNSHSTYCPTDNSSLVNSFPFKGPSSYDEKSMNFNNGLLQHKLFVGAGTGDSFTRINNINNNINTYNGTNSNYNLGSSYQSTSETVESLVNTFDEQYDIFSEFENFSFGRMSPININGGNSSTAPVNIPGARSSIPNLSPPIRDSPFTMSPFPGAIHQSVPSSLYDIAPSSHIPPSPISVNDDNNTSITQVAVSLFDLQQIKNDISMKPFDTFNQACDNSWKREIEEANRIKKLAEQQRDEALNKVETLQQELHNMKSNPYLQLSRRINELEELPLTQLKQLEQQFRTHLNCIEKVISNKTGNTASN